MTKIDYQKRLHALTVAAERVLDATRKGFYHGPRELAFALRQLKSVLEFVKVPANDQQAEGPKNPEHFDNFWEG